jgi:hypothetical protein
MDWNALVSRMTSFTRHKMWFSPWFSPPNLSQIHFMANCQTFKIFVLLKRVRGEDLVLFKIQGTGQRSSESTPGFELGWRDIYYSLLLVVAMPKK